MNRRLLALIVIFGFGLVKISNFFNIFTFSFTPKSLDISEIDYYKVVYYKENWDNRDETVEVKGAKLTTARMFEGQYVGVLDLPPGPPTVTREDLHRVRPHAVWEKAHQSKSAKLPLGGNHCKNRSGTALATSGNFMAVNSWHQMVSVTAHYNALRTVDDGGRVDYLVLSTLTKMPLDASSFKPAFKVFYTKGEMTDTTDMCFKRIIFTDQTPGYKAGWVGAMWKLAGRDKTFHDTMEAHPMFALRFREMVEDMHRLVEPRTVREDKLCYMKRKVGGRRGFRDEKTEASFQSLLKPEVVMAFDYNEPNALVQVRTINQCSTLIGTHGAGLGHMLWADPGLHVVEMGDGNNCRGYYYHLAHILGHSYECIGIGSLARPDFTQVWLHLSPRIHS